MIYFDTLALGVHVAFGSVAVLMGAIAFAVRKGGKSHIKAGRAFAICMGVCSVFGGVIGLVKFETFYITFHAGILGATLVTSGWLLARAQPRGSWFFATAFVNVANVVALACVGAYAMSQTGGVLFGFEAANYLFLCMLASIALIGDLFVLLQTVPSKKHRVSQHILRMCIGFFIAAGSAFTGPGQNSFPEIIRKSGILSVPEPLIFVLMVFWLVRTLFCNARTPLC